MIVALTDAGMNERQLTLATWYAANRRRLPWREQPTPYRVWLSEIMLQQTRVETVLPYFERFLDRWPTVSDLAAAELDDVLSVWSGLGYYSRARRLHAAAIQITERGAWPNDVAGLRKLPGVGPYTAGAIASIAFGRDEPAVDGNIERVTCRLHAYEHDPRTPHGRRDVWALAAADLPVGHAGDHNQALMDLGSRICTPRKPSCEACPLRAGCCASDLGLQDVLPRLPPRKRPTLVRGVCAALIRGGRVWMVKRPPTGLLAGLLELPGAELTDAGCERQTLTRIFEERLGLRVVRAHRLGEVRHVFSHRRLIQAVWRLDAEGTPSGGEWLLPHAQRELSTLAKKTLALALLDEP